MGNERGSLVEHPVKYSIITLKGGVLGQKGGHGWIEHDEAVLEHPSNLIFDKERLGP